MSILCIEQYQEISVDGQSREADIPGALIAVENVAASGSSAQSAALNSSTKYVILTSDVDVYWSTGSNPTATTSDRYLVSFTPRAFTVTPGDKIAVITK